MSLEKHNENMPKKSLVKSRSTTNMTPEEMYRMVSGEDKFGIPGYIVPRRYFDYDYEKWVKKREKIINGSSKPHWPPNDWPYDKETDKKIPPVRSNFIDDQIKWAHSFYDKKRAEEVKEQLESRGHPYVEEYKKEERKNRVNLRNIFLKHEEEMKENRKKMEEIPEWRQGAIEQVQEKIKAIEEEKKRPRVPRPNFTKCDRVTVVAEAEFVGESIPFYNNPKADKEGRERPFNPTKEFVLHRSPSWSIGPRNKKTKEDNPYIQARDALLREKAEKALEKSKENIKDYIPDAVKSYDMVQNRGKLPLIIRKRFEYEKTEQYQNYREKSRDYTPGPGWYWDDGKGIVVRESKGEDVDRKKYVMTRDKTQKRIYISGMRKSVF